MNDNRLKTLRVILKLVLGLLMVVDFGVMMRILTEPMSQAWVVIWVAVLSVTGVANLISWEVFSVKAPERSVQGLEILVMLVSLTFACWAGRASYLVLTALIPVTYPAWIVTIAAFVAAALYLLVKLACLITLDGDEI